jgi:hypothetical protein
MRIGKKLLQIHIAPKVVCNLKLSHYQESFSDGIAKNLPLNVFCHIFRQFRMYHHPRIY